MKPTNTRNTNEPPTCKKCDDELYNFVLDQFKATNCICRLRKLLKNTYLENDLECLHCRAKNLLTKAGCSKRILAGNKERG